MKISEIKINGINPQKSFSPIRKILLLEDKKWEKFKDNNTLHTLGIVETMFASNEIFPTGIPGVFKYELGKFLATIDTFQVTLCFLYELACDSNFKSIINDFRMAIQNFELFLYSKSYYSAFMEFRKMLEGILWMKFMKENKTVPSLITKKGYQNLLKEINFEFGEAYSVFNSLFHYRNDTPLFNINRLYKHRNDLFKFLNIINSIADLYEREIKIFINSFNNKTWNRYNVLLQKLTLARKTYNLKNMPIQAAPLGNEFGKAQEEFASLILDYNSFKMMKFKYRYEFGIKDFANGLINNANGLINNKNKIYRITKEICVNLLVQEIKVGGSLNLAFLRSLFEDIFFNSSINKNSSYMHTSLISEFLIQKYNIEIKPLERKFSHLLRDDRIIYDKEEISKKDLNRQIQMIKSFSKFLINFSKIISKLNY